MYYLIFYFFFFFFWLHTYTIHTNFCISVNAKCYSENRFCLIFHASDSYIHTLDVSDENIFRDYYYYFEQFFYFIYILYSVSNVNVKYKKNEYCWSGFCIRILHAYIRSIFFFMNFGWSFSKCSMKIMMMMMMYINLYSSEKHENLFICR